jgi:hypothetical protein
MKKKLKHSVIKLLKIIDQENSYPSMVIPIYNLNYSGGRGKRILSSSPVQAKVVLRLCHK